MIARQYKNTTLDKAQSLERRERTKCALCKFQKVIGGCSLELNPLDCSERLFAVSNKNPNRRRRY